VRAFFLLDFDSQGDGITFTLTSFGPPLTPHNSATSVGGDIELSELVGYAGDSRLVPNADPLNDLDFLATNPNDRGLDPPKIAVEFDTRTNNTAADPPPDYCSGADANADSRNDPLTGNKDAVQYVFWGRTSFLNIPCRDNNTLYDDNRHDADGEEATEEWRFGTSGPVSLWRPAIGPDGSIYMSDQVDTLYAFDEDGTVKWTFNLADGNAYMPGVDPVSGTVYSDVAGNDLLAVNPDGSQKWRLPIASDIDSTPIVGDKPGTPAYRTIFFGTDFVDSIFAVRDNGTDGEIKWQFVTGDDVNTVPALSPDGTVVYAVSNDNNLYAVNVSDDPLVDGTLKWQFPILAESGEVNSSLRNQPGRHRKMAI
jgi:outer membrane protein assembly factor BamB